MDLKTVKLDCLTLAELESEPISKKSSFNCCFLTTVISAVYWHAHLNAAASVTPKTRFDWSSRLCFCSNTFWTLLVRCRNQSRPWRAMKSALRLRLRKRSSRRRLRTVRMRKITLRCPNTQAETATAGTVTRTKRPREPFWCWGGIKCWNVQWPFVRGVF